jgi:hypothetical protein
MAQLETNQARPCFGALVRFAVHGLDSNRECPRMTLSRNPKAGGIRKLGAGCLAVMALAACSGDSTDPSVSAAGSYALTSYDAQPLPVVLRIIASTSVTPGGESFRCEDRLAAMKLALDSDGRFASTSERRLVCDNGDPDEVTHPTESGSYQVGGTAVTLTFDEVDGMVTVATGALDAGSLTITKRVTTAFNGSSTDPTRMEFERTN